MKHDHRWSYTATDTYIVCADPDCWEFSIPQTEEETETVYVDSYTVRGYNPLVGGGHSTLRAHKRLADEA